MTEEEARAWIVARFGDAAASKLAHFVDLLETASERQNLIARSTFESIWTRHIVDSAQLVSLAPADGLWIDVGSGAGLPGLVVACLRSGDVLLVEPRRMRTDFMRSVASELDLSNAQIETTRIQTITTKAAVISARAVAPLIDLFDWTRGAVSRETCYILPRGQSSLAELESAQLTWQGRFHVEQSVTDPKSGIIVAHAVRPR